MPELDERDVDSPLAPEVMTIELEINGENQHNLRAQYLGAACPYSRKHLLVPPKEALRGAGSAAPPLPRSRNEAHKTAPSDPL